MSDKSKLNSLLTPFNIGKLTIKNRFVMGPMGFTKLFYNDATFPENTVEYLLERAKGGFGAIIQGVLLVDNKADPGVGANPLTSPRFYSTASRMNERCNAFGTKVIGELGFGTGRNYEGMLAPSPVEVFGKPDVTAKEITKAQINQKIDCMIEAAQLMKKSGYAGVDVHTLHWGYLMDEFVMSLTNKRTDEYGGNLENRMRVVKEVVRGIKETCGEDYPVTIGLCVKSYVKALNKASLTGEDEAGRTLEESIKIVKMLEDMGIDAIMTDTGVYDSFYYACPPSYMPKGHGLELYAEIKKNSTLPIMARSRMGDPYLCADALEKGQADAFVLARPALADPYFPRKIEEGCPEKIRPCIGCNIGCIGSIMDTFKEPSCAVNPRAVRELFTRPKKSVNPLRIAIVGSGAAGMQAALTAVECGHSPELFEKSGVLGGEMIAAGADSSKQEVSQLREWFIGELNDKNVPIHLNVEFTPDMADKEKYDAIILAVGASSVIPKKIKGIENAVTAVELLEKGLETGENVVVVGAGMVGCETAVDLAKQGKKVTLVEARSDIMKGEFVPMQHDMMLRDLLKHYNVDVLTEQTLAEVAGDIAVIEDRYGVKSEIKTDKVVISIGLKSNPSMYEQLIGKGIRIYEIGSGRRVGAIYNAIHDAFEVVYNFD